MPTIQNQPLIVPNETVGRFSSSLDEAARKRSMFELNTFGSIINSVSRRHCKTVVSGVKRCLSYISPPIFLFIYLLVNGLHLYTWYNEVSGNNARTGIREQENTKQA